MVEPLKKFLIKIFSNSSWLCQREIYWKLRSKQLPEIEGLGRSFELDFEEMQALEKLWRLSVEGTFWRFRHLVESLISTELAACPLQLPIKAFQRHQREKFRTYKKFLAGKRVALVGPSATVVGLGLGHVIDGHDLVVRLNAHWPVSSEMIPDLGNRMDVLYHCCNGDFPFASLFVPEFLHTKFVMAELGIRSRRLFSYCEKADIPIGNVSPVYTELRRILKHSPSTGLVALHHLLSCRIASLSAYGLSFSLRKYLPDSLSLGARGELRPHNYNCELEFLRRKWWRDPRLSFDPVASKLFADKFRV